MKSACALAFMALSIVGLVRPVNAWERPATYAIFSPAKEPKPPGSPYAQLNARGNACFDMHGSSRRRNDADKVSKYPFPSTPEIAFVLDELPDGSTHIMLRDTREYLTADYRNAPPTVVVIPKPDDSSRWRIIPAEEAGKSYIQNIGPKGQELWLSIDKMPILVAYTRHPEDLFEYRQAVLTDNKTVFEISKIPLSK